MSFTLSYGLHGCAAEEYETAREVLDAYRRLQAAGAKYLSLTESGRDIALDELTRRASGGGW